MPEGIGAVVADRRLALFQQVEEPEVIRCQSGCTPEREAAMSSILHEDGRRADRRLMPIRNGFAHTASNPVQPVNRGPTSK